MAAIPNDIREGIEAAITRGLQDDIVSTTSEKKHREEYFASIPSWMAQCHRQDYEYDTTCDIASATFALPGGELLKVKRLWTGSAVVVTAMVYRYWIHRENRWAKADTLDHAIYCATELTREEMIAKAKKELDAQEESA